MGVVTFFKRWLRPLDRQHLEELKTMPRNERQEIDFKKAPIARISPPVLRSTKFGRVKRPGTPGGHKRPGNVNNEKSKKNLIDGGKRKRRKKEKR